MEKYYKIKSIVVETVLSTIICAIGVCLFIEAGLGSDTIDVLIDGMHRQFSITLGQADQIFTFTFLLLAFLCNRQYIGLPSIAYSIMIGFMIDFVNQWIMPLQLSEASFMIRILCVLLGQFCFALSYGIFQTVEKGMNTVDAVIYFLCKKTKFAYRWVRTIFDIIFFIMGIYLGGVIGIGTIFSVCFTGIMTDFVHQMIVKLKRKKGILCMEIAREDVS